MYSNSIFQRIPSRVAFGAGAQIQTGDLTTTIYSGDLSIPLGGKAILRPALGLCHQAALAAGEDDFNEFVYGGTLGVGLFTSRTGLLRVNVQAGLSLLSYGDGYDASETSIPVAAAAEYEVSQYAALFAGAGIQMWKSTFENLSQSGSDPFLFGGTTFMLNRVDVSAGIGLLLADETGVSINFGVRIPMGG
jgi:hypothetical protein